MSTAITQSSIDNKFYPNFDWLRVFLAIQVVAIHCGISPTVFINPVSAFLAISGFVVLGSIRRRSIRQFFISRTLRVLPLLFVSFIAVGILYSPTEMFKNIKFWLWPTGPFPPNPVVWTLIYEEAFYTLLAILFSIGFYKKKLYPVLICITMMLMMNNHIFLFFNSSAYMLGSAFFLGNVIYLYQEQVAKYINKYLATLLFIISIIAVYNLPYIAVARFPKAYIDFLSFATMIIFAIAGPQLPRLKVDLSYSIYLIHVLVIAQLIGFVPLGPRLFVFALLSTLPISFASWHIIEKPALQLKIKLLAKIEVKQKIMQTNH